MKRIILSICIMVIGISATACSIFTEVKTDIETYGDFFERAGSISEYWVFPDRIPDEATDVKYECRWNDVSLIDPMIQIYLEYKLDEDTYASELERIKNIRGNEDVIQLDEENFNYPAYVAANGYAFKYEYVLIDEENRRLIYVHMWHQDIQDICFDKEYLPSYFGKEDSIKEELDVYAWLNDLSEISGTVDSSQEAAAIAEEYVVKEYGDKYADYWTSVEKEDDIWIVSYLKGATSKSYLGGGGPTVEIRESDGEVIDCKLQK